MRVVPRCLVPGPRMIRAEVMGQVEEVWLCVSLHIKGMLLDRPFVVSKN